MSKPLSKAERIKKLEKELDFYQSKLQYEMKGYRGVIHESAASEIKHSMVKLYEAMVNSLQEEIKKLQEN